MKQPAPSFRKPLSGGLLAFWAALPPIVVFEALYKIATALVAKPLLSFVMQQLLRAGGGELAFNDGIWRFALTIPGVLAILLLSGFAAVVIYFEFAVVVALARQAQAGQDVHIKGAIVHALWSFGSLKNPSSALFVLYALVLLPLVNIGLTSSLLPQLTVPNFITGELGKMPLGELLLGFLAFVVFVAFCCLLFTLPAMVLDHCSFGAAVKKSLGALRAYRFKMAGVLLVFAALWLVLFLVPRQIFNFFFGAASVSLADAITYYGFSLQAPVMLLIWLAASFLQLLLMPLLLSLLTAWYLPLAAMQAPPAGSAEKIETWLDRITGWLQKILGAIGRFCKMLTSKLMARPFIQKHKKILAVLLVLVLAWAVVRTLMVTSGVHDPIVIGHRGSAYGVENTLEAIQSAIDTGADYTEVDILLSADGVPMVIHDTNLQRLSGQNRNVYELTAEELVRIPLSQNGYTGYIPTLEQVVDHCEGKILLAVEYKQHGHEQADLVEQVMRVMKKSDYQKNSIFLSLDYGLVRQMKTQHPAYRTGYCVYGNVGQLSTASLLDMDIDFLLVEEWMASKGFVAACRKAWLPVYVWTANDPGRMDDYLRMGVVGLVTDHPDAAVAVMEAMYNLEDRRLPAQVEG